MRFRIHGAYKKNGLEVSKTIIAESQEQAESIAGSQGILIASVESDGVDDSLLQLSELQRVPKRSPRVNTTYVGTDASSESHPGVIAAIAVGVVLVILLVILIAFAGEDSIRPILTLASLAIVIGGAIWIIRMGVSYGVRDANRHNRRH